jgi:hypothetical protein
MSEGDLTQVFARTIHGLTELTRWADFRSDREAEKDLLKLVGDLVKIGDKWNVTNGKHVEPHGGA